MKKLIIMFLSLFLICGCSTDKEDYKDIMKENEYVIIDVRTKEEYDEEHIVDALNIPYDEINESIDISKNKVVFVYCKSGKRSSIAYETLKKLGYTVYDLGSYSSIELEKK